MSQAPTPGLADGGIATHCKHTAHLSLIFSSFFLIHKVLQAVEMRKQLTSRAAGLQLVFQTTRQNTKTYGWDAVSAL